MQSYVEIEQAMQRYSMLLEQYVNELQKSLEEGDKNKFVRMKAGSKAMRDSSQIYLSYAKYVAYGMPEGEELAEEEDLQA
ncbi:MAG: hypothetical protein V3T42_05405 [Nitrospirales bacterium]